MAINIAFAGSRIKRPGAYSTVDTSGLVPVTTGAFNVLAFVGKASADATIASQQVAFFNEPANAREALKSGALLEAAEKAWEHGADLIAIVRVDPSTQAKMSLAVTAVPAVELTSKAYGTSGNSITAGVEVIGTKTFVVIKQGKAVEQFEVKASENNTALSATITKISRLVNAKALTETKLVAVAAASLTGGTGGGAVTDTDWQKAIDLLNFEDVNGIVPVTAEAAVIAKVQTHVESMSSVKNRKERRAFYGHVSGLSVDDVILAKAAITSERGFLATPASGADSVKVAAACAGLWASKAPQDPITYDFLNLASIDKRYSADEIETLIAAGVTPVEFLNGRGYRIVQGVTTSTSDDLSQAELSVSTLKDVMSRSMREYLEDRHVGNAGVPGIAVTMYNDAMSQIQAFIRAGYISEYVADSLKIIQEGTAYRVDWEGKPTLPINNFLITSRFTI